LCEVAPEADIRIGDFLAAHSTGTLGGQDFDVAIGNPPFSKAAEFVRACRIQARTTVMLLPLNFLATEERCEFNRTYAPDVYVLPQRPSFTGRGTAATDYAWFVWSQKPRSQGIIRTLALTPSEQIKYWKTRARAGGTR
jgi:hypothetical protein